MPAEEFEKVKTKEYHRRRCATMTLNESNKGTILSIPEPKRDDGMRKLSTFVRHSEHLVENAVNSTTNEVVGNNWAASEASAVDPGGSFRFVQSPLEHGLVLRDGCVVQQTIETTDQLKFDTQ